MDIFESAHGERRRFMAAAVLVLMVGILAPPAVQAAAKAITVKKVKQAVKVVDTSGDEIESEAIPPLGTTQAPGSDGALAVRTYAGGGGLLGLGDCNTANDPSIAASLTVGANVDRKVTAIIITPDTVDTAAIAVTAPAVTGLYPPLVFHTDPAVSLDAQFIGLGNGLTVTPSDLVFTCATTGAGNDTKFVVLGQ